MKTRYTSVLAICATAVLGSNALAQADMHHKHETKSSDAAGKPAAGAAHKAVGVVKKVDAKAGNVTLFHEPVKSLDWPAMTMAFKVKDPALFEKLSPEKRIEFEFIQEGRSYVVTSVK